MLLEANVIVRIGSRALDILIALVERPGQLISKEELMARVWPNLHVEPANLTVHIAALRRLLGARKGGNRYLINIPGRGYRFVAAVSHTKEAMAERPTGTLCINNLPSQVMRLVGRNETLNILTERLGQDRLLTIVGPGGVGKTVVALAAAERAFGVFEDGVWHVDFAGLSDASLIPGAIACALRFDAAGGSTVNSLVEHFRNKRMLLVFDNCEHLVDAAASAASALLRGAPDVRILATSREPLLVEGEQIYRLSPLAMPLVSRSLKAADVLRFSAVELFVRCVTARLGQFELTDEDAPFVVSLCRRLDGIPLVIEFAASLIDTIGVRCLLRRLEGGLHGLTGGFRTATPRHQTLRSMLDWSYDWLPERERMILRRLSVLNGDFTLEQATAAVLNDEIETSDVSDSVAGLVTKSLVLADIAGIEPVYRLLETTRAYALQKLRESDEIDPPAYGRGEKLLMPLDLAPAT